MSKLRKRDAVLEERKAYEVAQQRIAAAYAKEDQKFEEWKEGVLKFEHSEFGIDDNLGDDDRICDGESVRSAEDEDDFQ